VFCHERTISSPTKHEHPMVSIRHVGQEVMATKKAFYGLHISRPPVLSTRVPVGRMLSRPEAKSSTSAVDRPGSVSNRPRSARMPNASARAGTYPRKASKELTAATADVQQNAVGCTVCGPDLLPPTGCLARSRLGLLSKPTARNLTSKRHHICTYSGHDTSS